MTVDEDQLIHRLKELDPAAGLQERLGAPELPVSLPTDALVGAPAAASSRRPRWRTRKRPTLGIAAGATLLGLTVLALGPVLPGSNGHDVERSPAAAALLAAGGVAQAEAAEAAGVSYTRVVRLTAAQVMVEKPFTIWRKERREVWIEPDGSGRIRTVELRPEWPSARDHQRWVELGAPNLSILDFGRVEDERLASGRLTGATREGGPIDDGLPPSRDLPVDPDELHDLIYATAENSPRPTDPRAFDLASAILMQPGATPALKAAAYEVLAGIPGIELRNDVRDPQGRVGTGVALEDETGERHTLIFDPGSASPFAETDRLAAPNDVSGSRLLGYSLVEETDQVPDLSSRP